MTHNMIEPGDFVHVYFPKGGASLDGIVTYTPCAEGDAFHIRPCELSGEAGWINTEPVIYVQHYEIMRLVKKSLASKTDLVKLANE